MPLERQPLIATAGRAARSPTGGLVGAYSFDEGSGTALADDSGNGNVGRITGATWARGRYGNALSFDGATDVVRVPASASLDVGSGLTLSAWVRPAASESGWRTIVHRERDAFFLVAGSDIEGLVGRVDDLLRGIGGHGGRLVLGCDAGQSRTLDRPATATWPAVAGMLLVGCAVDAAFGPSATLFAPTLLAVWFAASATDHAEAAAGWLVAVGLTAARVASLADCGCDRDPDAER